MYSWFVRRYSKFGGAARRRFLDIAEAKAYNLQCRANFSSGPIVQQPAGGAGKQRPLGREETFGNIR